MNNVFGWCMVALYFLLNFVGVWWIAPWVASWVGVGIGGCTCVMCKRVRHFHLRRRKTSE